MKMKALLMLALCLTALASARAQQEPVPKTIAASVGDPFRYAQREFLSVVEAMPEAKYGFVHTSGEFKGARSFAEQVKHVACASFGFFSQIEGKTPPEHCEKGGPAPARTKAELVQYLRDSFDYANRVLATITPQNALMRVEAPMPRPTPGWASRWWQCGTSPIITARSSNTCG